MQDWQFVNMLYAWCGCRIAGEGFVISAEQLWQSILLRGAALEMTEAQVIAVAEKVLIEKVGPEVAGQIVKTLTTRQFIKTLGTTFGETVVGRGSGALGKVGTATARNLLRGPIVIGAVVLALVSAGCSAKDEIEVANNTAQLYAHYMRNYIQWAVRAKKQHPQAKIAQPMLMEEWNEMRFMVANPH